VKKIEFNSGARGLKVDGETRNVNLVANFGTRFPEAADTALSIADLLKGYTPEEQLVILLNVLQDLLRAEK
jgi:hypothetical protein